MNKSDRKDLMNVFYIVSTLALIGVIWYGGTHDWFNFNFNFLNPGGEDLAPTEQTTFSTCSQVCSDRGYSKFYDLIDDCKAGEYKVTYGYPGKNPLLVCCCYNENTPVNSCVDSDGNDKYTPGNVKYNGDTYMDKCIFTDQDIIEYTCVNNKLVANNLMCDGQECIQSRSGGYCKKPATNPWNPGDVVFQGSGGGVIAGDEIGFGEIDLADYGITTSGTCRLGAQIQTSWSYANNFCTGLQGMDGMRFQFFDSSGLEYTRVDAAPMSLGVDLHPETHILQWDGVTNWMGIMSKTLNLPNCVINYQYDVKIYIYNC